MPQLRIYTPLTDEVVESLHIGQRVLLNGVVYTGRDAAHKKMVELLDKGEELPIPLQGQVIYYVGPSPAKPGRVIGSAGPTTSGRMDPYAPVLIELGLRGMIGKGLRAAPVVEAMKKYGAVYFAAIGGAGALLAKRIKKAEVVAYPDLGPEAIYRLEVEDFPVVVALDSGGRVREVAADGHLRRAGRARERGRRMALVPQTEHTPFDYTVLEYVLMGRAPHLPPLEMPTSADTAIALSALEQVGIASLAERPVPQLSGGERQLMLLARALAQIAGNERLPLERGDEGALLLLDEPTAHLDLRNKARLIAIMRRLREAGVTLLMTNHEPDIVLAVADDVLLLEAGAPPLFGARDQVFTAEALTRIYQHPIRLVQVDGRQQVVWT